ncbi:MAG: sigma-54-dependent Fis family transcriptional regulator [Gammaproteobacteria bacterium]|nr:MAG: sigma-54-dependent Fis family transcriptional regulator [Gammaproteobacteria bacterium]
MSIRRVLIVDDEPDIRELLEITLQRMGLETVSAPDLASGHALLAEQDIDLCLTDMRLPDGNGIELVEHIQQQHPEVPVAMITAYGSMDSAVAALKAGAFDFVSKPVDLTMLRNLVDSALRLSERGNNSSGEMRRAGKTEHPGQSTIERIVARAPASRKMVETIRKLARSQAPVFIHGESGSGKELVARSIHELGPRASGPFIAVNCGAIPADLMESEFFGHLRGSFTGATADKQGLFEAASGGTLFLDEIAELPLAMQVKLLRAIQERAIKPIGAAREIPVDVRILSATHKDLQAEMQAGRFRQDLYFRINVIQLDIPPLRERREDLDELVARLLEELGERWGGTQFEITEEAMDRLRDYTFPGNIRELENVLERAATLCENNRITGQDLEFLQNGACASDHPPAEDRDAPASLADQERALLMRTLEATRWNRSEAARRLGLTLRQLRYRIEKYGLDKSS